MENPKVEVTSTDPETQTPTSEDFGKSRIVTTPCPRCGHTTAFLKGSVKNGASIVSSGAMNVVQYECKSCKHVWSLGY